MRVLLDTNIFISYLLSNTALNTAVTRLIEAAAAGRFTVVLPTEVVNELDHKLATKRYLRSHISSEQLADLMAILQQSIELLPPLSGSAPSVVRDPKDNYLLAAAAYADVDVLVSGDLDLLVLRDRLHRPAIMTAAEFVTLIDTMAGTDQD